MPKREDPRISVGTGSSSPFPVTSGVESGASGSKPVEKPATRRGKAPPVEPFDGEAGSGSFKDWLPSLQRAAVWNHWSDEECLVQLAGHLRKRALQAC